MPNRTKHCTCGTDYSPAAWDALPLVGVYLDDKVSPPVSQELKNCPECRSTLVRGIPVATARAILTVQHALEGSKIAYRAAQLKQADYDPTSWRALVVKATQAAGLAHQLRAILVTGSQRGKVGAA